MSKIRFEVVNSQVEMLFSSGLAEDETVDDRLLKIEEFISACGWNQDEFELHKEFGTLN
jgi:hypothetical protein